MNYINEFDWFSDIFSMQTFLFWNLVKKNMTEVALCSNLNAITNWLKKPTNKKLLSPTNTQTTTMYRTIGEMTDFQNA